jgi:hypothetical protein
MRRALATLAVLAAVAGCGNATSSSSPSPSGGKATDALEVIDAAARATAQVHSAHMVGSMSEYLSGVSMLPGQPPVTLDFSGHFDGTLRLRPLAGRMTVTGLRTNGQSVGGTLTELITGAALYLHMPQLAARTGKPWAVIRFDEMSSASGVDFGQMMQQAQQMDPNQFIKQLVASGDVHRVGAEVIRGLPTTHYAGTVPVSKTIAQFSGSTRAAMQRLMHSAGISSTTVDVWLDAHGLVRRARSTATSDNANITATFDIVAYNVAVDVTPPPASQTVDLATMH